MLTGLVTTLVALLVPTFSLSLGLGYPRGVVRAALREPVVLRVLPVALLGVPVVALALATLLPLTPVVKAMMVLLALCPGLIFLNILEGKDPRRAPLVTAIAIALMVAGVLTLPVGLWLLNHLFPVHFRVGAWAVLGKVVLPLLVPLALGIGLKMLLAPQVVARLRTIADVIFKVSLACALLVLLVAGAKGLAELRLVDGVAIVLFVVVSAMMGHLAGGHETADRELAASAVVMGNPSLALLVAATSYPNVNVLPTTAVLVVLRSLGLLLYKRLARRVAARPRRVRRHAGV